MALAHCQFFSSGLFVTVGYFNVGLFTFGLFCGSLAILDDFLICEFVTLAPRQVAEDGTRVVGLSLVRCSAFYILYPLSGASLFQVPRGGATLLIVGIKKCLAVQLGAK